MSQDLRKPQYPAGWQRHRAKKHKRENANQPTQDSGDERTLRSTTNVQKRTTDAQKHTTTKAK
jgi:hypothetical protein